jgi:hypothetical protein
VAPLLGNVRTFALLNELNEGFSVLKDFRIHKAHRLEFRAEFFNVLNRVVCGSPSANLKALVTFGTVATFHFSCLRSLPSDSHRLHSEALTV